MSKIYVTSVDETTGQCHGVGIGTDTEIYETFGMFQVDAEQSDKDGNWYLTGRCPMFTSDENFRMQKMPSTMNSNVKWKQGGII